MTTKRFLRDLLKASSRQRISVKNFINSIISDEGDIKLPSIMVVLVKGEQYVLYDPFTDKYTDTTEDEIKNTIANNPMVFVYSNKAFQCKNFIPLTDKTFETLQTL